MHTKKRGCLSPFLKILGIFLILGLVASMVPVRNGVPFINQHPDFPNGCEVVALSSLMDFHGYEVSAGLLHDRYMAKSPIGQGDPKDAYIGDPRGQGYYSFQGPLVDTANAYFHEEGIGLKAKAYPVTPYLALAWQVHRGRPVIAWTTLDGKMPERVDASQYWKSGRRTVKPYRNLHVHVVTGMEGWNVLVMDPTHGSQAIPLWEYLPIYYAMGARVVMVEPEGAGPDWEGMVTGLQKGMGDLIQRIR